MEKETIAVETIREDADAEEDFVDADADALESVLKELEDNGSSKNSDNGVDAKENRSKRRDRWKRKRETTESSSPIFADGVQATATATASSAKSTSSPTVQLKINSSDYEPTTIRYLGDRITENENVDEMSNDNDREMNNSNDVNNSDSDESDMFQSPSSEDETRKEKKAKKDNKPTTSEDDALAISAGQKKRQDGFDDAEGYYKASIGEIMELEVLGGSGPGPDENLKLRLRVLGVIGKGVFSSVLKCSTNSTGASTTASTTNSAGIPTSISIGGNSCEPQEQHGLPSEVAIKCIRSNETMAKAALDEMKFLIRLRDSPGIVPLLLPKNHNHSQNNNNNHYNYVPPLPIDFRGHTLLVFPYLPYNLRDVLQKFGKGVGLSLVAVKNYFGQLLSAATHLQKHKILHADIKPDNILVSADFSTVLLADFGSAMESSAREEGDEDERDSGGMANSKYHEAAVMPTPYLVSRFYRAPEIILSLHPLTSKIDLWSLAVTAGELFLGKVLLSGANNNDMLYVMMENLGPFPPRVIKSHLLQTRRHPLPAHFSQVQSSYVFKQETVDRVLDRAVHKEVSLSNSSSNNKFRPNNLTSRFLRAKSSKDSRKDVLLFSSLLNRCLMLDPSKRIGVKAALKDEFFNQQ